MATTPAKNSYFFIFSRYMQECVLFSKQKICTWSKLSKQPKIKKPPEKDKTVKVDKTVRNLKSGNTHLHIKLSKLLKISKTAKTV